MMDVLIEVLESYYLWIKALHIISVISWMAGIFYLPRLFIYHVENQKIGIETDLMFQTMERKLLKIIMMPAMALTWIFGIMIVLIPGVVDWSSYWPWVKTLSVVIMTIFHFWLAGCRKEFIEGKNSKTSKQFRMANEIPTLLMFLIVFSVVLKF